MVSLDRPTIVFGPPWDKASGKPPPSVYNDLRKFVGIPDTKFNGDQAQEVYRKEYLFKEKNLRFPAQIRAHRQNHRPGEGKPRLADMMPGYANVSEIYDRMGFEEDIGTRRRKLPEISLDEALGLVEDPDKVRAQRRLPQLSGEEADDGASRMSYASGFSSRSRASRTSSSWRSCSTATTNNWLDGGRRSMSRTYSGPSRLVHDTNASAELIKARNSHHKVFRFT
mmetsp:Transcript_58124/g.101764  ORF Transcript_58124/g.101764 Transcript_58124/m.101764 type:complete len:225 (-) Transcript_58124:76-750(-)